jgi:hypothetical protein
VAVGSDVDGPAVVVDDAVVVSAQQGQEQDKVADR